MARQILMSGALMALLGVAIGAFGAHGLKPFLSEQMLAAFETGVRYHLIHALGMLTAGLSLAYVSIRQFRWAGWAFFLGIVLFAGSLYVMSISGIRALGIVTLVDGAQSAGHCTIDVQDIGTGFHLGDGFPADGIKITELQCCCQFFLT